MARITKEEFISKAKSVHGDKYDYSKVEYVNNTTKVCIICPIHGEFLQRPSNHVNAKQGCSKCFHKSVKRPVYGVGINDTDYVFETKEYKTWRNMLERWYCKKTQDKFPTYKGCTVCDEWHTFSNFKRWFQSNYIDGWELDKDILSINNKVYSPQTCCFVPRELNSCLRRSVVNKEVGIYTTKLGKYIATINVDGKRRYLGTFESFEDAKNNRDKVFIAKINQITDKYKDVMPSQVFEACRAYYKALCL